MPTEREREGGGGEEDKTTKFKNTLLDTLDSPTCNMSNGYEILKKCQMVTKSKRMGCMEYEV